MERNHIYSFLVNFQLHVCSRFTFYIHSWPSDQNDAASNKKSSYKKVFAFSESSFSELSDSPTSWLQLSKTICKRVVKK